MLNDFKITFGPVKGATILLVVFSLGALSSELLRYLFAPKTSVSKSASQTGMRVVTDHHTDSDIRDILSFDPKEQSNADSLAAEFNSAKMLEELNKLMHPHEELKSIKLETGLLVRPGSLQQKDIADVSSKPAVKHLAKTIFNVPKAQISISDQPHWIVLFIPRKNIYCAFGLAEYRRDVRHVVCTLSLDMELKTITTFKLSQIETPGRDLFAEYAEHLLSSEQVRVMY